MFAGSQQVFNVSGDAFIKPDQAGAGHQERAVRPQRGGPVQRLQGARVGLGEGVHVRHPRS